MSAKYRWPLLPCCSIMPCFIYLELILKSQTLISIVKFFIYGLGLVFFLNLFVWLFYVGVKQLESIFQGYTAVVRLVFHISSHSILLRVGMCCFSLVLLFSGFSSSWCLGGGENQQRLKPLLCYIAQDSIIHTQMIPNYLDP